MMILSRLWYVLLALVLGVSLYVVYVAVGQFNRRNHVAMNEALAADSQVVRWSLQIDSRRRLDALLVGAVDKGLQDSLVGANGKPKVPEKSKTTATKALASIHEKIPEEYRGDVMFAIDRDGRVVANYGFPQADSIGDFELGGYPATFDALHGYLRDDCWVWGGRIYRVSARPVEYDVSQPPVGAIVAIREVDGRFAKEISKLTRANIAFFAAGQRVSSASGDEGFDERILEAAADKLGEISGDEGFQESGRSGILPVGEDGAAIYARLEGDSWLQGAGFVVARSTTTIDGPLGFLTGADDKDKANVSWLLIVVAVLLSVAGGVGFSVLEVTLPRRELKLQAARLKKGEIDLLQLARFRAGYRPIATDLNAGIERVAEKGGAPRKQADLEQILGPVPAQPSMSAFSLPGDSQPSMPGPTSGPGSMPKPPPSSPGVGPRAGLVGIGGPTGAPASGPAAPSGPGGRPPPPRSRPKPPPGARAKPPAPGGAQVGGAAAAPADGAPPSLRGQSEPPDETTRVAQAPDEVIQQAAATSGGGATDAMNGPEADWPRVFADFVSTKKQCGESVEGLTFEKFEHTLRKNRDALIARHGCKHVKFTVYIKEGRASLKATPVKDA